MRIYMAEKWEAEEESSWIRRCGRDSQADRRSVDANRCTNRHRGKSTRMSDRKLNPPHHPSCKRKIEKVMQSFNNNDNKNKRERTD